MWGRKTAFLFIYWAFIMLSVGLAIGFAFGSGFSASEFVMSAEKNAQIAEVAYESNFTGIGDKYAYIAIDSCGLYNKHRLEVLFGREELDAVCGNITERFAALIEDQEKTLNKIWTQ